MLRDDRWENQMAGSSLYCTVKGDRRERPEISWRRWERFRIFKFRSLDKGRYSIEFSELFFSWWEAGEAKEHAKVIL